MTVDYPSILRGAGFTVSVVPAWRTNTHPGEFVPQGGMWHHTTALNDLDTLVHGRIDVSGPLCNLWLRRDGSWVVVCGGIANHGGPGHLSVLEDLRHGVAPRGDAAALGFKDDGHGANAHLVGIEVEGGVLDRDDFPQVQLDALVAGSVALSQALGFTANQWIHHREWTRRKPDMAHRGDLRGLVAAGLADGAGLNQSTETTTDPDEVVVNPPPPPVDKPEDVMYVVIEAPDRSPAFFTPDGIGHAMGRGGWTFINRFASKHPGLVVFDTSWSTEEYDLVVRLPAHSVDEPIDPGQLPPGLIPDPGQVPDPLKPEPQPEPEPPPGPVEVDPPDLQHLPDDVPDPTVGTFD